MKGVFIAGIIAAFAITVVDSLDCAQCHTYNSTCEANATLCAEGSLSCVESSVNSTLGGFLHLYQNKFCSALNCSENSTEVAFTVRVFDNQRYRFASQCCQEKECNGTHYEPETQDSTGMQCVSCYNNNNNTNCTEKLQECYKGEQCVHVIMELKNGSGKVELKGCSDISNSTCQVLSAGNVTVGEFIFKSAQCTNPANITSLTTVTPQTTGTPRATVTSQTSVTPSTSMGIKASFTSSIFGSLLLLKLLL